MERVLFTFRIRPECAADYRRRHAAVWPEMLAALRAAGWCNYSVFLAEDGLVVGYLETEDFEAAQAAIAASEVNRHWQREMAPLLAGDDRDAPGPMLQRMPLVFHTD